MPEQFDPDAAGVVHCAEDFDTGLSGIPNVITGLALRSVNGQPARQTNTLTRELGQEFFHAMITPALQYDLDGYDLLEDGTIANAPIGKPLTRAQIGQFSSSDSWGLSTSAGYFAITSQSTTREAGANPRGNKTTVKLIFAAAATVNHVQAP